MNNLDPAIKSRDDNNLVIFIVMTLLKEKRIKIFLILLYFLSINLFAQLNNNVHPLTSQQQSQMQNVCWYPNCPVQLNQLVMVTVPYWGFDNQTHQGIVVVNKKVANQVLDIFQMIYAAHFSIEKIKLIEDYHGNDDLSMADNNSSGFNCRNVANSKHFSLHSYGLAIDINPLMNPYVREQKVLPSVGRKYLNRAENLPGMIKKNDVVYLAFKKYHWTWGGDWAHLKDYGHFEKRINNE